MATHRMETIIISPIPIPSEGDQSDFRFQDTEEVAQLVDDEMDKDSSANNSQERITGVSLSETCDSSSGRERRPIPIESTKKSSSKWVLGVRQLSLSSDQLNRRMVSRGMLNSSCGHSLSRPVWLTRHGAQEPDMRVTSEQWTSCHPVRDSDSDRQYPFLSYAHQPEGRQIRDNQSWDTLGSAPVGQDLLSRHSSPAEPFTSRGPSKAGNVSIVGSKAPIDDMTAKVKGKALPGVLFFDSQRNWSTKSNLANALSLHKKPKDYKRRVNRVILSERQELSRYKHQFLSEVLSLTIMILAVLFVTITPFLLIPIWVIPNEYSVPIRNFLWVSLVLSVVFLVLAALVGNVYWYFDERKSRWRWFFHCGRGPVDHYWGSSLFYSPNYDEKFETIA